MLDKADAALARSRVLRDRLANTTDVTILTRWIDRNAAYDAAVRKLYTLLVKSKGKVNKDVRTAFAEVSAAQAALPARQPGDGRHHGRRRPRRAQPGRHRDRGGARADWPRPIDALRGG